MNRKTVLSKILSLKVIAVIRMKDRERLKKVIGAIHQGGVKCIEITLTVPCAAETISELRKDSLDDAIIGAGTVLDVQSALTVIQAGAQFVVSPVLNHEIIKICHEHDVVCVPGCFSPTEIYSAWNAGADIVKVFPATVLTPKYFKDLSRPFPDIRLMPTGGVTIENAVEWINAGACAIAIGTDLLDKKLIEEEKYDELKERAEKLITNVFTTKTQSLK